MGFAVPILFIMPAARFRVGCGYSSAGTCEGCPVGKYKDVDGGWDSRCTACARAVLALTVSAVAAAALARVQAARRASSRLLALPPGGSKAAVRTSVSRARSEKVVAVAALVCALSASTASSRWTRAYGMPSASPFLRALRSERRIGTNERFAGTCARCKSGFFKLDVGQWNASSCRVRRAGPVSSNWVWRRECRRMLCMRTWNAQDWCAPRSMRGLQYV